MDIPSLNDGPLAVEFQNLEWQQEWCKEGHAGLSGEFESDFDGRVVRYAEGSAILIPAGTRHKARHPFAVVRLFLVEEGEQD